MWKPLQKFDSYSTQTTCCLQNKIFPSITGQLTPTNKLFLNSLNKSDLTAILKRKILSNKRNSSHNNAFTSQVGRT